MVRIAAVPITALDLPQRAASPAVPTLKRVSVPTALKAQWPSCLLQISKKMIFKTKRRVFNEDSESL
jgi:hypothetical protein